MLENDSLHDGARHDGEIGPSLRCSEITSGWGFATSIALCDLEWANTILVSLPVIKVRITIKTGCAVSSLNEGVRHRVELRKIADSKRAVITVCFLVGNGALLGLALEEVRKDVLRGPAGGALRPCSVIGGVSTMIEHDGDGVGAAEDLAAGEVQATVGEIRLGFCDESPVVRGTEEIWKAERDVKIEGVVGLARLEEQDANGAVLGEAVGKDASRGTASDDDVVVGGGGLRRRDGAREGAGDGAGGGGHVDGAGMGVGGGSAGGTGVT